MEGAQGVEGSGESFRSDDRDFQSDDGLTYWELLPGWLLFKMVYFWEDSFQVIGRSHYLGQPSIFRKHQWVPKPEMYCSDIGAENKWAFDEFFMG